MNYRYSFKKTMNFSIKRLGLVLLCLVFVCCSKKGGGGNDDDMAIIPDPGDSVNVPPSSVEISTSIFGNTAEIVWGMASDEDGDQVSYGLSLENETIGENLNSMIYFLEDLEYDTVYNGKLIISDGKASTEVTFSFKTDISLTYFAYSENNVYALNGYFGNLIWTNTLSGDSYSSAPFYYGDKLLIGGDRKVYCLNANDGVQVWEYDNPTNEYSSGEMYFRQTPIVDTNNVVHVSAAGRPLSYGLDLDTGTEVWKFFEENSYYGVIGDVPISAHYQNSLVTSSPINQSPYGRIVQLNRLTGLKEWQYIGEHEFLYAPIIIGDHCYIMSNGGLYCIDLVDRERKWLLYNEQAHTNLAIDQEENLYMASGTQGGVSIVRSIRPDGSLLWEKSIGSRAYSMTYKEGKLWVYTSLGVQNDKIVVLDSQDGSEVAEIQDNVTYSSLISSGDLLFYTSYGSQGYSIKGYDLNSNTVLWQTDVENAKNRLSSGFLMEGDLPKYGGFYGDWSKN